MTRYKNEQDDTKMTLSLCGWKRDVIVNRKRKKCFWKRREVGGQDLGRED